MVDSPGTRSPRNFRLNPLEAVVFAAIFGVFGTSVYRLFDEQSGPPASALSLHAMADRMHQTRRDARPEEQPLDAVEPVFQAAIAAMNIDCRNSGTLETSADRVRLGGSFCAAPGADRGPASAAVASRPSGATTVIVNRTNGFTATLFELPSTGRFLTDYIPLEAGDNRVVFEFHPRKGRVVSFERTIVRRPPAPVQ